MKEITAQLDANGYDSLDFFGFALKCGIPVSVLTAAGKKLEKSAAVFKQTLSTEDLDKKDDNKGGSGSGAQSTNSLLSSRQAKAAPQLFSQHLIHQFPLVSRQVENGLYSVKRVGNYLKKLCTFEEEYSKEMLKATNHETTKLERVQGDGMKHYMNMWIGMQEVIYQIGNQHQDFRAKMMSAVVLPLQAFYKEAEEKRKEVLLEMTKLTKEIKLVNDAVLKAKKHSLDLLEKLKASQERDKAETNQPKSGMLSKLSTALKDKFADSTQTLKEKAIAASNAYIQAIEHANKTKKRFRERELPRIFDDLQNIEVARLDVLKEHLTKFSLIFHEMVTPLEELSNRIVQNVAHMDTYDDINQFVETWVEVHGEPPKHVAHRYDLPCSAEDLRKDRWDGSMELKTDHNSIFGTTLSEVMKLQQAKYPDAKVPLILLTLVDAIRRNKGTTTEGIFRISAPKSEIDKLHREFDKGNYEVKTENPHVAACLLKEWLRELSEALINPELYQACVDLAKEENIGIPGFFQIYDSLPQLTRDVIEHLAGLLIDVIKHKDVTKMTVDNIAIVFAPNFLRCESDDPVEMMTNSKFETRFVTLLLTALMERK